MMTRRKADLIQGIVVATLLIALALVLVYARAKGLLDRGDGSPAVRIFGIATGDSPELRPYTKGSITCPAMSWSVPNSAAVIRSMPQPEPTAAARIRGNTVEMGEPT